MARQSNSGLFDRCDFGARDRLLDELPRNAPGEVLKRELESA